MEGCGAMLHVRELPPHTCAPNPHSVVRSLDVATTRTHRPSNYICELCCRFMIGHSLGRMGRPDVTARPGHLAEVTYTMISLLFHTFTYSHIQSMLRESGARATSHAKNAPHVPAGCPRRGSPCATVRGTSTSSWYPSCKQEGAHRTNRHGIMMRKRGMVVDNVPRGCV